MKDFKSWWAERDTLGGHYAYIMSEMAFNAAIEISSSKIAELEKELDDAKMQYLADSERIEE
jgi:hypothetical protein